MRAVTSHYKLTTVDTESIAGKVVDRERGAQEKAISQALWVLQFSLLNFVVLSWSELLVRCTIDFMKVAVPLSVMDSITIVLCHQRTP